MLKIFSYLTVLIILGACSMNFTPTESVHKDRQSSSIEVKPAHLDNKTPKKTVAKTAPAPVEKKMDKSSPSGLVPNAQIVGTGTYEYFFKDIYDITLSAPDGQWSYDKPFSLRLNYHISVDGSKISEFSVKEIKRTGNYEEKRIGAWQNRMDAIFPDVKKGDSITGYYLPNDETIFYSNGKKIGTIDDKSFGRPFFDIWLGSSTRDTDLTNKILGK